jgi:hypothetical protein
MTQKLQMVIEKVAAVMTSASNVEPRNVVIAAMVSVLIGMGFTLIQAQILAVKGYEIAKNR